MADLITVISVVNGALSLALQLGETAKSLSEIAGKHKRAELIIRSIVEEIETIQIAWEWIVEWFDEYSGEISADSNLFERLDKSLRAGDRVIAELEADISIYRERGETLTFFQRSKVVWIQTRLQDHQSRVRG